MCLQYIRMPILSEHKKCQTRSPFPSSLLLFYKGIFMPCILADICSCEIVDAQSWFWIRLPSWSTSDAFLTFGDNFRWPLMDLYTWRCTCTCTLTSGAISLKLSKGNYLYGKRSKLLR
jgi:hypothetical protein